MHYYVVGLGNPGAKYQHTPHNIGQELVKELVCLQSAQPNWQSRPKAWVYTDEIEEQLVEYILPTTYMNHSGEAVTGISTPDSVIVVYDDITLPFGEIRLSKNRGDGGHNGIKSIEKSLKSRSFIRFRVGVAPRDLLGRIRVPAGGTPRTTYLVDKQVSLPKRAQYPKLAKRIASFIQLIVTRGYDYAVSKQGDL